MAAADYVVGGVFWPQVQSVMNNCGCSRLRAVSALKSCRNDAALAIASLKEMESDTQAPILSESIIESPALVVHAGTNDFPLARAATSIPASSTQATAYMPNQALKRESSEGSTNRNAPKTLASALDTGSAARLVDNLARGQPVNKTPPDRDHRATPPLPINTPTQPANSTPSAADDSSPPLGPAPAARWDFKLPRVGLDAAEDEFSVDEGRSKPFSPRRLITILQHHISTTRLHHYLSFYNAVALRERINEYVCGYPAIFYIVAANDPGLLRAWAEAGGDVNATDPFRRVPLLAFAILMGHAYNVDSTGVVVELLSLGASVSAIPRQFFSPYIDDPVDKLPLPRGSSWRDPRTSWCLEWMEPIFASQVNLTQRYFLDKATKDPGPTDRQLQVAQVHGATPLLLVSSFLIGQISAARTVTQKMLSHMALPRSKPLVVVFAGPSGHGKTELARRMGQLLSLEIECVDCTEMKHETDLFGAKKPYIGYDVGSPLNNFLARLNGKRCIVFLDEFEKAAPEVRNALLVPFDEGKHIDRRNRSAIDCTQTIWVIATNAVDHIVLDYSDAHKEILDDNDLIRQAQLVDDLSIRMKKQLKAEFGNPLSGRVSAVIPFLPFSTTEAAVITHKYILELMGRVRQDVCSSGRQLVGRIMLQVRRDGAICRYLAEEGYDSDHGARSLKAIVDSKIEDELVKAYLEEEGQIQDRQPLVRYAVDLTRSRKLCIFKVAE